MKHFSDYDAQGIEYIQSLFPLPFPRASTSPPVHLFSALQEGNCSVKQMAIKISQL
jgi:hypothetical protein